MVTRKRTSSLIQHTHILSNLIIRLRDEESQTYEEIGKQLEMGKSANRKIYRRVKNPKQLKKAGRPRVTDYRLDFVKNLDIRINRRLVLRSKKDAKRTALEVQIATGVENVSVQTVRRSLAENNLRAAFKKPFISKKNMIKRKQFAKEHLNWEREDWRTVL